MRSAAAAATPAVWPGVVLSFLLVGLIVGLGVGLGIGYTPPIAPTPAPPPASQLIYNSTAPGATTGDSYTVGVEPYELFQAGDYLIFAGVDRHLANVSVTFITYAYQSEYMSFGNDSGWDEPVTLTVYQVGPNDAYGFPTLGLFVFSVVQTFLIPWRPEPTTPNCTSNKFLDPSTGLCSNGLVFTITFQLDLIPLTVPDQIVLGIAYNTADYGPAPYGSPGPYDDLAQVFWGNVTTGTRGSPTASWFNTLSLVFYCDNSLGINLFRPDENCPTVNNWAGYAPQFLIYATSTISN
jgi:hypothetical protein